VTAAVLERRKMAIIVINPYQYAGSSGDPYFSNVSILLHGDGTNGSTTFTDSSSNNHTLTVNGDTQISTAQSKFGGSSMYFDGTGDFLTVSDSSLALGTGEYTIELWVYILSAAALEAIASCGTSAGGSWQLRFGNNGIIDFRVGTNTKLSATISFNTWHHLAVTRDSSNTGRMFLNGTIEDSSTFTNDHSQDALKIGVNRSVGNYFDGYIDDFRITKGVARYTSNFTPPTEPFPDS